MVVELIKNAIIKNGRVLPGGIVKVDGFLNHQIDVGLIDEIGKEIAGRYINKGVTKVLTIEASGISIACAAARDLGVPALYAKKGEARNIGQDVYSTTAHSFTRGMLYGIFVSKKYLSSDDNVLLVDDFLANGSAAIAMIELCEQAGAQIAGFCTVINKTFAPGGRLILEKGVEPDALVRISAIDDDKITFED